MISNTEEFYHIIGGVVRDAVEEVFDKALTELKKCLGEYVYGAGSPVEYERTEDFYNSWEVDKVSRARNVITGEMTQHWENMSYNPSTYTHGSYYAGGTTDVRSGLAEIIFEGLSGGLFGEGYWMDKRDAWSAFEERVSANIDRWMKAALRRRGLTVL